MSGPRILYIAGSGRSGSTLLHNMLAQVDGFFGVGELRYVWRRGFIHGKRCGCGERILDCPLWGRVFGETFGGLDAVDAEELAELTDSFRVHHLPTTFVGRMRRRRIRRLNVYLRTLSSLYHGIASVTGAEVIVDSSKNPAYGYLLTQAPDLRVSVVHMVRDPRAVAFSWSRTKLFEPDETQRDLMARKSALESAMQWNARNAGTELVVRPHAEGYTRVRYEDLVAAPGTVFRQVLTSVGEDDRDLSFVEGEVVRLERPNHSVFGNLIRFDRGSVAVRRDDEWQREMTSRRKTAVAASTWPLRARYGY